MIDHEGNKIVGLGNDGRTVDRTIVEPSKLNEEVKPPDNLAEILAEKERRLKEIPDDQLSEFDVASVGKPQASGTAPGTPAGNTNPVASAIKAQVHAAIAEQIKKIDIGAMVAEAIKEALG